MRMKRLGNTGLLVFPNFRLGTMTFGTSGGIFAVPRDQVSALPPEYPGWMLEFQGRDRRAALK